MKITVVTVTYNSVRVLGDCLSSLSDQTYELVEHVAIDGASTDGTLELLRARKDQLTHLVSEPDSGIYDAMNKGVRLAMGDVIGFLNSDDLYAHSGVLERVANVFAEDPELEACYADLVYTDKADTSRLVRYWKSGDFLLGAFSKGWCPPHPTFFARRSVFSRLGGFNLNYKLAADFELMMRFLSVKKIRVRYVPEVWVKMRSGGTTNKNLRNILIGNQEILRALRSHGLYVNPIGFFSHKLISRSKQFFSRPAV